MAEDYICPLCKAERLTKRYYENSLFWIADCPKTNVPIVVLNEHRRSCTQSDLGEIMKVCNSLFDMKRLQVEFMDASSSHFHFHLLPLHKIIDKEENEEQEQGN